MDTAAPPYIERAHFKQQINDGSNKSETTTTFKRIGKFPN